MTEAQKETIQQLQKKVLELQGFKTAAIGNAESFGLGALELCFPHATFPTGTIHEFIAENPEQAAASEGFISGLLAKLMEAGNACIWISKNRRLFPPAMEKFGVNAQNIIFIDLNKEKEILWVMEEALKCEGIAAVIAELPDLDFAQSRRLQLVTEKSHITGILLRKEPKRQSSTACTVRWQLKPQPSQLPYGLPGVGNPTWEVTLLKVRNGQTGNFLIQWAEDHFAPFSIITTNDIPFTKQVG
jgi:protein ImuA